LPNWTEIGLALGPALASLRGLRKSLPEFTFAQGGQLLAAEKQTFWNEFFQVFGISRRTVASFETPVKKLTGYDGFIDLFWKGVVLVEHKSLGGDLGKAQSQAFEYIQSLAREGKRGEIPRYIIVSDFARI
jgi:hypothetical protein